MTSLINAAGVEVEPIWTTLFARALEGKWFVVLDNFFFRTVSLFRQRCG